MDEILLPYALLRSLEKASHLDNFNLNPATGILLKNVTMNKNLLYIWEFSWQVSRELRGIQEFELKYFNEVAITGQQKSAFRQSQFFPKVLLETATLSKNCISTWLPSWRKMTAFVACKTDDLLFCKIFCIRQLRTVTTYPHRTSFVGLLRRTLEIALE